MSDENNPFRFNYLVRSNADYIEELWERYQENPFSIDESWRYFFEGIEIGSTEHVNGASEPMANGHAKAETKAPSTANSISHIDLTAEARVGQLITMYRARGWLLANINPLEQPAPQHPILSLENFGLNEKDLATSFKAGKILGLGETSLKNILTLLRRTYCSSIGAQYSHIQNAEEQEWLQERLERGLSTETLTKEEKVNILNRLSASETFERFLHTRFVGQKRFSLEGGESLIPMLDRMISVGANLGAEQYVMGMAHRGRLNVLRNVYGKKPEHIFTEFEQNYQTDANSGEGDVKYHMGFSADVTTPDGKAVHLSLAHNPSHLEFVNPVVEGIARGKQRYLGDKERTKVVPVLIHGDAAFAGQGVVYETLNLSQLRGYWTGGTIHIVINNQIGFTTTSEDARSTTHATDLAKMLEIPIFHVNGDDPEACYYVARLCAEFRQKYRKDVVIDLICYRKYGHNESDEPAFTQPMLYNKIKTHPSPREIYAKQLAEQGVVSEGESQAIVDRLNEEFNLALQRTREEKPLPFASAYQSVWKNFRRAGDGDIMKEVKTSVDRATLIDLGRKLNTMPEGFKPHPKLERMLAERKKAIEEGKGIDWGNAETLAYATLLTEKHAVRLSGQDVERGTFSHRHSVLHDYQTGKEFTPLNHLSPDQEEFLVQNSSLSEAGVLGFDYGWSLADPSALVIWEAQFGDFVNGAQVIIDQFISSGESKWQRASGIVLLLPHGYEGQGPEHSSARLERFLQQCGKQNMTTCNLTTPAQIFHALRRQLKREFRKPLVVMSPKSLLRHPQAQSTLDDLSAGAFKEVIDDPRFSKGNAETVKRVVLCSGKVYYELLAEQSARNLSQVAIVRVEQLYPWPAQNLAEVLKKYRAAESIVWTQEEPRNMGAWSYVLYTWMGDKDPFQERINGKQIQYVGRERAAAPAVGSAKRHAQQQKELIDLALAVK